MAESLKKSKKEKFAQKNLSFKKAISKGGEYDMVQFDKPRPMPIDPSVYVKGVEPASCFVFKSAMYPVKMSFYSLNP